MSSCTPACDCQYSVSSIDSRSSTEISTAAGLPCRVIVTRSCVVTVLSISSLSLAFTSVNGNVLILGDYR